MGDKRCLSYYFVNFCIVFLGTELNTRESLDKKFIIISEIDQKFIIKPFLLKSLYNPITYGNLNLNYDEKEKGDLKNDKILLLICLVKVSFLFQLHDEK